MPAKKKINVTVDAEIHDAIRKYFRDIGEKFNLSAAVQEIEMGIFQGIMKHKETVELVSPVLRAKTSAGLLIADAFQTLFSDIEKEETKELAKRNTTKRKTTKTN